jgi:hypothetical protein
LYDTIAFKSNIYYDYTSLKNIEWVNEGTTYIKDRSSLSESKKVAIATASGYFENRVHVEVFGSNITISCSLPMVYGGNNYINLSKKETKECLEYISVSIGINVEEFEIIRCDIATCIIMDEKISEYIKLFNKPTGFKKENEYNNCLSINYMNGVHVIAIYDKNEKTIKKDREEVPNGFENKNVFRFESRLKGKKKVWGILGKERIKGRDLYEDDVWDRAIEFLYSDYVSIPKTTLIRGNGSLNMASIKEYATIKYLVEGGYKEENERIEFERRCGGLTSQAASNLRGLLNDKMSKSPFVKVSPLIEELDAKMREFRDAAIGKKLEMV